MKAYVERGDEEHELEFEGTAAELMEELDVNPEAVLIVRNGEIVTEDEEVSGDDEVEFRSVVSGG